MEDEKRVMEIDEIEFAIIINALMSMRNALLEEKKETDLVDKVIRKTIKAPSKEKSKEKGKFHKKKRDDSYESR